MTKSAADIRDLFVKQLKMTENAARFYWGRETDWTKIATDALVRVGDDIFRKERPGVAIEKAAKRNRSKPGRSEHLTIDVVVYEEGFGQIHFAAEHENKFDLLHLKYCAWKLLHVKSEYRVLVAYCNGRTKGFISPDDMADELRTLMNNKLRGRELTLVAGNRMRLGRGKPKVQVDFDTIFEPKTLVGTAQA